MGCRFHCLLVVKSNACGTGSLMRLVLELTPRAGTGYGLIFELERTRWDLRKSSAWMRLKRGLILPGSLSPNVSGDFAVFCGKTKIQARTSVRSNVLSSSRPAKMRNIGGFRKLLRTEVRAPLPNRVAVQSRCAPPPPSAFRGA